VRDFPSTPTVGLVLFMVAFVSVAAGLGFAAPQFTTAPPVSALPIDQQDRRMPDDPSYVPRELQARQLKRLREEHQKQVYSDAARLVQLATALKQQVQKGDKVSLDAIKDVDEIGKLAKRVSDRIKTQ
jgi:hypothetical protein